MANLFLIPTSLDENAKHSYLLAHELAQIKHLKHFIVETAKTGRRHLNQLGLITPIQQLNINELNKHSNDLAKLIKPLVEGFDVGLLSDCGAPAIADPGRDLVAYAHERQINIIPLIGPSSLMLALMSSGANGQNFAFCGYLPIDSLERENKISHLQNLIIKQGQSQIIIETPFRNQQLFNQLIKQLEPNIYLSIAVNLTTPQQLISRLTIKQWQNLSLPPKLHKQQVVFILS